MKKLLTTLFITFSLAVTNVAFARGEVFACFRKGDKLICGEVMTKMEMEAAQACLSIPKTNPSYYCNEDYKLIKKGKK